MSKNKKIEVSETEYDSIVGEDGSVVKPEKKPEVKKVGEAEYDKDQKVTMFTEIKFGTFKTKSHFLSIIISAFLGLFAIHDFYLGLKRRGFFKLGMLGIAVITTAVLFSFVNSGSAIGLNYIFQMFMMLPILLYVLWWSYDFVTIATKSSKRFKHKEKTLCQHDLKKRKDGTYICKKCKQVFNSDLTRMD